MHLPVESQLCFPSLSWDRFTQTSSTLESSQIMLKASRYWSLPKPRHPHCTVPTGVINWLQLFGLITLTASSDCYLAEFIRFGNFTIRNTSLKLFSQFSVYTRPKSGRYCISFFDEINYFRVRFSPLQFQEVACEVLGVKTWRQFIL